MEAEEIVTCPVCGNDIKVWLEWQEGEYDVGINEGWRPGIDADSTCIAHLSYEQAQNVEEQACTQHGDEPPSFDEDIPDDVRFLVSHPGPGTDATRRELEAAMHEPFDTVNLNDIPF